MNDLSRGAAHRPFFTELTFLKALLYSFAFVYVLLVMVVSTVEPFLKLHCAKDENIEFPNPGYESSCRHLRHTILLGEIDPCFYFICFFFNAGFPYKHPLLWFRHK
jgi:hypothetical protein